MSDRVLATPPTDPVQATADSQRRLARGATALSLSTVVVSGANYAFALLMARLLGAGDYVAYASVQSVLLILGAGGMAAVPWAVAHHLATGDSPERGREALRFGLIASGLQGAVFAVAAALFAARVGDWTLATATAVAALSLSLIAAPMGVLQGRGRLPAMAVLRVVETVVRIASSLVLVLAVTAAPASPVAGFTLGGLTLLGLSLWLCRDLFPLRGAGWADTRSLASRSAMLGAAQLTLVAMGVVDTVVIGLTTLADGPASAYQVAALLGRVPLFLSAAVALSFYPAMASAGLGPDSRRLTRQAACLFLLLGVPTALLVATVPEWVMTILLPVQGPLLRPLLPATALLGLSVGLLTVLATSHQAQGRFRRLMLVLVPSLLTQAVVLRLVGEQGSVEAYAWSGAVIAVLALVAVGVDLGVHRGAARPSWSTLLTGAALLGLAAVAYLYPPVWLLDVVLTAVLLLFLVRRSAATKAPAG